MRIIRAGDIVLRIIRASDLPEPQIELTHGCWTISPDSKTINHHIHNSDGGENYHIRFEPRRVVDSALVLDKIVQVAMKQGNGINWNQPDCTYYLVRALDELFGRLQGTLCPGGQSLSIETAAVWRRFSESLKPTTGFEN